MESMTRLKNLTVVVLVRHFIAVIWRFIFKPAARYPADPRAVFILALSVFSGAGALAANAAPETLEALLPRWGVIMWGVLLATGSAATLIGMLFQSANGIITEQIGSVMVGVTTVFYSVLALWVIGGDATQPVGIILAWGLSCFVRWIQLQALINDSAQKAQAARFEQAVTDEVERRDS
jgi:hypothetical protein